MRRHCILVIVLGALAASTHFACHGSGASPPRSSAEASEQVAARGLGFATPDQAARALVSSAADFDVPALLAILGPDGRDLVASEDTVQDEKRARAFAAKASERTAVALDPADAARATLFVGNDDWPLPIPIVERDGSWYFDSAAGRDEVLRRRIGANELAVLDVFRGYVVAQREYASAIHDDSGVHQYAQRIVSTPGSHDGLAWQNADGTWGGPVGPNVGRALEQGYGEGQPFHGYYFKILKGQGPSAPLGTLDYRVGGVSGPMIGGFALLAWPAEYGVTGVETFLVSYDGVVYQKALGPDTPALAAAIDRYNPDETWQRTDDES
jgi:hypothetical protein